MKKLEDFLIEFPVEKIKTKLLNIKEYATSEIIERLEKRYMSFFRDYDLDRAIDNFYLELKQSDNRLFINNSTNELVPTQSERWHNLITHEINSDLLIVEIHSHGVIQFSTTIKEFLNNEEMLEKYKDLREYGFYVYAPINILSTEVIGCKVYNDFLSSDRKDRYFVLFMENGEIHIKHEGVSSFLLSKDEMGQMLINNQELTKRLIETRDL